jgi:tetratricopeptide (TPR) repeat protein
MTPFGILRKKEQEAAAKPAQKTLLEELCGGNDELYQALSRTILLNPRLTAKEGIDSHVDKAQEHEKNGDNIRARIEYQVAGELAIYEEKLAQAQKFFKKAAEADPNSENRKVFEYLSKKENAERALAVAQEFYSKTGKRKETIESPSA